MEQAEVAHGRILCGGVFGWGALPRHEPNLDEMPLPSTHLCYEYDLHQATNFAWQWTAGLTGIKSHFSSFLGAGCAPTPNLGVWRYKINEFLRNDKQKQKSYLSRFFVKRFGSIPSIKLSNHCDIAACLSGAC